MCWLGAWVAVFLVAGLAACSDGEQRTPKVLRVGVLPDQSKAQLLDRYGRLLEYLEKELGLPHDLVIPETYQELATLFHQGKLDLAYFGGVSFVAAMKADGAVPLVMRDIDLKFTSAFLVRADDPAPSISDFRGRRLAFGSNLSTSGHLMPRFHLEQQSITPESFFASIRYSGAHDRTAYWVRDGTVDLGVANSLVIANMFQDGRLSERDVRILWTTPPYADYVWAVARDLDVEFVTDLRDAFLKLSPEDPAHRSILTKMGAGSLLPASAEDFADLAKILENGSFLKAID
ncbi:MAG: phosphate/phosphite/phosphonate ABC transporter substrate-binding protein [Rhodospirillales bacterium]|jgi:phosphonate transport system substrate-binding protein|nr:phosphate/phosphite/phosphonate ABC transporter substrate-binding protein [Rhodospirillales bacterium]